MARPHKGERLGIALRLPVELHAEVTAEAEKFDVDRHAFIVAMIIRGLKSWRAT